MMISENKKVTIEIKRSIFLFHVVNKLPYVSDESNCAVVFSLRCELDELVCDLRVRLVCV